MMMMTSTRHALLTSTITRPHPMLTMRPVPTLASLLCDLHVDCLHQLCQCCAPACLSLATLMAADQPQAPLTPGAPAIRMSLCAHHEHAFPTHYASTGLNDPQPTSTSACPSNLRHLTSPLHVASAHGTDASSTVMPSTDLLDCACPSPLSPGPQN